MSKSLGTLTLDLIARTGGFVQGMDAAERKSAKWRKQVEKDVKAIGRGFNIASAAVTVATAAMVVSTVKTANEVSRLAQASNISTLEFQRNAAGAKLLGVEQDKLGAIYKDTNDKLGDFMQTGAGPLADFFEQVAPQIGVTADMFRKLSGPDALQLYVDSLEKANVSQNDMTFYMEAIASEALMLLPLLRDNGAGFELLGDQAERLGSILNGETITASEQMGAALYITEQASRGLKNQIAEAMLPTLSGLATELAGVTVEGHLAADIGEKLAGILKGAAMTAVGTAAAFDLVGKGIGGIVAATKEAAADRSWYDAVNPFWMAKDMIRGMGEDNQAAQEALDGWGETADEWTAIITRITSVGEEGSATDSPVNKIAEFLRQAREAAGQAGGEFRALGKDFDAAEKEAEKSAAAIQKQITALEVAADTWGMSSSEIKLYTLEQDGATDSQLTYARSLVQTVEGLEATKKAHEDYADLLRDLRTDEEVLADQMRERLAIMDAMSGLTDAQRNETASRVADESFQDAPDYAGLDPSIGGPAGELAKIDEAQEKLQEWYDTQLSMLEDYRAERSDLTEQWDEQELALKAEHEERLAEIERARQMTQLAAGEEFFGNMAGAAKAFFGENSKLYKAAFALEKGYAVAKAMMNIPKSYSDAFAAVVGIPIIGPALAPAAGVAAAAAQVAQAASIRSIGLDGQAHDGIMSVPSDGTWNLKKGERVTTAETSAKLDRTLDQVGKGGGGAPIVNLIEDASRAGQSQSRQGPDGKQMLDVFVANIRQGGAASKAIQESFGMKRVGR